MLLRLICCCAFLTGLVGTEAIHHHFEGTFAPVRGPQDARSVVQGQMPPGWTEDSTWPGADVTVRYARNTEAPFSGAAAWSITVEAVRSGRAQMVLPGVPLDGQRFLRLRLATRSLSAGQMEIAISQSGPPWRHHWSRTIEGRAEWQQHDFLIPPVAADPQARLMLIFHHPTRFDIDEVELTWLDGDALQGTQAEEGNLLAAPAFPLGLAGGWVAAPCDREELAYASDPEQIGPSGLPALRLTPHRDEGRPMAQVTTAFWARGGGPYTVSAWMRGTRAGQVVHLRCGPPGERLWTAPWQHNTTLSTEWSRYQFTVDLPYSADGFFLLRLTTHDDAALWLDACQVEAGKALSDWAPGGPGQVALVLAEAARSGVHLGPGPLHLRWALHGATAAVRLEGSITDQRDRRIAIAPITLPDGPGPHHGAVALDTTGLATVGSYLVELTAVDAAGRALSAPAEVLLTRLAGPAPDGRNRASPFGIHLRYDERLATLARDLGFGWVRTLYHSNWNQVQRERDGAWDFTTVDRRFELLDRHGFAILGVLSGAPRWATAVPDDYRAWNAQNFVVRDLDGWHEYARRMAERYAGRVDHWEIWNEPFLPGFLVGGLDERRRPVHAAPEDFLPMLSRGAAGVRAGNPQALRLWNTGAAYDAAWDRRLVALGVDDHVDAISYHHYHGADAGFPDDALARAIAVVRAHRPEGRQKPLWNSEGGAAGTVQGPYRQRPPGDRRMRAHRDADHLVRYYVSTLANGVERFFLYSFYGYGEWGPNYDHLTQDGRPSFNAAALANLTRRLDGRVFQVHREVRPGLHAYVFTGEPGSTIVLLPQRRDPWQLVQVPAEMVIRDLYGELVTAPVVIGTEALYVDSSDRDASRVLEALFPEDIP